MSTLRWHQVEDDPTLRLVLAGAGFAGRHGRRDRCHPPESLDHPAELPPLADSRLLGGDDPAARWPLPSSNSAAGRLGGVEHGQACYGVSRQRRDRRTAERAGLPQAAHWRCARSRSRLPPPRCWTVGGRDAAAAPGAWRHRLYCAAAGPAMAGWAISAAWRILCATQPPTAWQRWRSVRRSCAVRRDPWDRFSPYSPSSRTAAQRAARGSWSWRREEAARLEAMELRSTGPAATAAADRPPRRHVHQEAKAGGPLWDEFTALPGGRGLDAIEGHARFEALHAAHLRSDGGPWQWRQWPGGLADAGMARRSPRFAADNACETTSPGMPFYQFIADRSLGDGASRRRGRRGYADRP